MLSDSPTEALTSKLKPVIHSSTCLLSVVNNCFQPFTSTICQQTCLYHYVWTVWPIRQTQNRSMNLYVISSRNRHWPLMVLSVTWATLYFLYLTDFVYMWPSDVCLVYVISSYCSTLSMHIPQPYILITYPHVHMISLVYLILIVSPKPRCTLIYCSNPSLSYVQLNLLSYTSYLYNLICTPPLPHHLYNHICTPPLPQIDSSL